MESANTKETEAMRILDECRVIMSKKANDYQNPHSRIRQADYYPSGVSTILDIMHAKVLRMRSVIEAMENDPEYVPNFESFEDSCKDLINYSAFAASYSRGKIDGQDPERDFLNRRRIAKAVQEEFEFGQFGLPVLKGVDIRNFDKYPDADIRLKPDKSTDDLS